MQNLYHFSGDVEFYDNSNVEFFKSIETYVIHVGIKTIDLHFGPSIYFKTNLAFTRY